jgi:hypothetical protein
VGPKALGPQEPIPYRGFLRRRDHGTLLKMAPIVLEAPRVEEATLILETVIEFR